MLGKLDEFITALSEKHEAINTIYVEGLVEGLSKKLLGTLLTHVLFRSLSVNGLVAPRMEDQLRNVFLDSQKMRLGLKGKG